MSRTSDSYASLIRGVSQQSAQDRIPGQHWEQINMISDPVRGLSRRHGSVFCDEQAMQVELHPLAVEDLASRREDTIFVHGVEYALFRRPAPAISLAPPLIAVNKDERKFLPVEFSRSAQGVAERGISAVTTVGQYVLLGAADRPATASVVDNMAPTANQHSIWIRGGAYSRTFTVTATNVSNGTQQNFTYTTMKSYYDQPLDTSDISATKPGTDEPNPQYTKQVNDRTNKYNSAVNKHIADAAKDITPENIAEKLAAKLRARFPLTVTNGPYIVCTAEGVVLSVDDGGNGEFARAASRDVDSPEQLTPKHFHGKVMMVQPKAAGSIPYYMVAQSTTNNTGFTEVVWKETAGEVVTPTFLFMVGLIHEGKLYVGLSPADLQDLTGLTDVPVYEPSTSGDTKNRQLPDVFGRRITYLQSFQDRLMMVAGSTVFLSRTGDYFNLFPASVLTVKDDDPIEVFALGTEDDTITAGVQMDRNVVLFGKRFQYVVPGREALTPRNAYVGVAATYEGSNLAPPAVGGSLLFFCQRRERRLTMQQMQPGSVVDRLEAFDVSAQLDGYLTGTPMQIVAQTSPSAVFIKTQEYKNGFYLYSFLDSSDQTERRFDSWSRWEFASALGTLVGITGDDSGLLAVTARTFANKTTLVLDRFTRETALSNLPYMDSLRVYDGTVYAGGSVVFSTESKRAWIGEPVEKVADLLARFPTEAPYLYLGAPYTSHVDLTSPYLRDREDQVILDAKLTVSKLTVSLAYSAAMVAEITTDGGKSYRTSADWIARPAGNWVLNTQTVEEQKTLPVPVMKDNKTYRMRLRSRNWLPMTVSVVEWAGQAFTSRR